MSFGYRLRPYVGSDVAGVVAVINADAAETINAQRAVVDAVGNPRLIRYVPAACEKVVVVTPDERIVGYAYFTDREQAIVSEVGGAVDPRYWNQGIGTQLLDWAEQRASALAADAPMGVKTVLQANLFESEGTAIQLFTQAGYRRVRDWVHLEIELAAPSEERVPDNLALRAMDLDNDWDIVGPVMDQAFGDIWGSIPQVLQAPDEDKSQDADQPEDDSFSNAPGFCFLVLADDRVVAGILCNAKLVEQAETGRIGSVFVLPEYRRRGIGRVLMLRAFDAFWHHGFRRIILDTDANSFSQAPVFYGTLGMRVYRHEYLYEKEIRPGSEVRRLQV